MYHPCWSCRTGWCGSKGICLPEGSAKKDICIQGQVEPSADMNCQKQLEQHLVRIAPSNIGHRKPALPALHPHCDRRSGAVRIQRHSGVSQDPHARLHQAKHASISALTLHSLKTPCSIKNPVRLWSVQLPQRSEVARRPPILYCMDALICSNHKVAQLDQQVGLRGNKVELE